MALVKNKEESVVGNARHSYGTIFPSIANTFIRSLHTSVHRNSPYDYWLLEDALPPETVHSITELPYNPPEDMRFNGKRDTNNSKRLYFNKKEQAESKVIYDVVAAFNSDIVRDAIAVKTGANLSDTSLRIEYCQDTDGFWLEPHTDISVKRFTMSIFLSDDPALSGCGTDIYDATPEHNRVCSAPFGLGTAMIFIPSKDTWHGFTKRHIQGVRKSLIINYVTSEWQEKWELA